jgi:hypothetical protein
MAIAVVYDSGAASPGEIIGSLADQDEVVVVLADSDHATATRTYFADECRSVFDLYENDLAAKLTAESVTGIVTYADRMIESTAMLAAQGGWLYHSEDVAGNVTSKPAQRRLLREAGVDSLPTFLLTKMADWPQALVQVGLPAVVKPVRGEASRNTRLIRDAEADSAVVEQMLAAEGALLVEELLVGVNTPNQVFGDYVSVETAVLPSGPVHYAISGRFRTAPPFRETGQFWPACLDPETRAAVLRLADDTVAAMGVRTGLLHTEIKLTPTGPRPIEINGRIGGLQPELASRAAGIDLIRLAADIALGRPVSIKPIELDRVHFQILSPGPTAVGTVRSYSGGAAVRALPGVVRHRSVARPGHPVGGTSTNILDLTFGWAKDFDSLPALITSITDALVYEFDIAGTVVTRSATSLHNEE